MSANIAKAFYCLTLALGYIWGLVQICVGQPFDGLVLMFVTESFRTYRNSVRKLI